MNHQTRTPKTLGCAIEDGICFGPLSEVKFRTIGTVKDFLAQRFQVAQLEAKTPDEAKLLERLWSEVIRD